MLWLLIFLWGVVILLCYALAWDWALTRIEQRYNRWRRMRAARLITRDGGLD